MADNILMLLITPKFFLRVLFACVAADERGRWWIVGSAWSGAPTLAATPSAQPRVLSQDSQFSQAVLEMARKQRMNTDNRRNIFCILMSAEVSL